MDPEYGWIIDQERRVDDVAEKWIGLALVGLVVTLVAIAVIVLVV